MTKRPVFGRLLPLWVAISAVILAVGIVICALFGFNYVSSERKTVEIGYDAVVTIEQKDEALASLCEETFKANGLTYCGKSVSEEYDSSYVAPTGNSVLTYEFDASTDAAVLEKAVSSLREKIAAAADLAGADVSVTAHVFEAEHFVDPIWRGAIAVAVAAIVVLVYVGFRFGVAAAVAGLAACVNDVLLTVFLLVLTRIPVYVYTPVLFGGISLVLSLVLWIAQIVKMRENFKDPAFTGLSAEEAVGQSVASSFKYALLFLVPIAAVFVVFGALASSGLRLFFLPALIPIAVSVYSSFLLAPAVTVPLKGKIDKFKIKRKRYVGKKKADGAEE